MLSAIIAVLSKAPPRLALKITLPVILAIIAVTALSALKLADRVEQLQRTSSNSEQQITITFGNLHGTPAITLIELLVVIAIIAVVMAVIYLPPSLVRRVPPTSADATPCPKPAGSSKPRSTRTKAAKPPTATSDGAPAP